MTAPKVTPDELLASLGVLPYGEADNIELSMAEIAIAQAVQSCRIANALEKIVEEGIWTAQLPEAEPEETQPSYEPF